MAGTVNLVVYVGRLTRDPSYKQFDWGGVCEFGLAVDGDGRKNPDTGRYESDACFLDCKAFDGQYGKKCGQIIRDHARKGELVYVRGKTVMERWQKDGKEHTRLVVKVEDVTLMPNPKRDGETRPVAGATTQGRQPAESPRRSPHDGGYQVEPPPRDAGDGEAYPDEPGYNRRQAPAEEELPF